jgi:hypothetical protein
MARKRVRVTVPAPCPPEPVIYRLVKDFDIVVRLRAPEGAGTSGAEGAGVSGSLELELDGEQERIEGGMAWLAEQGVRIDPAGPDVA